MADVRLLGAVEVQTDGEVLDLGASRPARLLLALLVADHRRVDLDTLIERCWDDDERPADPVPAIRTTVRRLRRALGDDAVLTRTGGYELDVSGLDVDVDRFDELIAAGRAASDPVAAITSFRRALDLWRGRPFGELGDLDWLAPERIRLEEAHLVAMEGWHESHLRNGTATEIIPSLESATLEHPLRERFHRQLMQALFVADRQADALRAFQTYREAMADAGLEPGPEAVELERRIVAGDDSLRTQTAGRALHDYRIVERLGEGAFSIVYRGTQPSVDRDVAIKQIRAELANRPEFIRRFEAEARMVAHLEHPFIVPLYDYWREPGSAYLVMRLLPGGSLESSLLDGPWGVERTARMVEQIGAALTAAHRAGVVHRDVKPANILLDDEGNAYLTDFGIALTDAEVVDAEASLSAGSPAYASPEQLRREPVGPSADVHGLAIAVYEALTGRLPFPDEPTQAALLQRQLHDPIPSVRASRIDVPAALDDVLQRATAKRATDRYQTIEEFVAAFEGALGETVAAPVRGVATMVPTEERNPYKGLRAFDEGDAADFAGRERLVDQLVGELAANRLLAVVGPSGSGKSSVVRAGLLPALRRGAAPGSADWYVATLLPGEHPDEELEATLLSVAAERPPGLLDVIRDGDRGISRALRQVLPENGQLLLVIDQFEELFTLCDDEAVRRRFLDGLAAAVTEERSRLHVVLTLRADFFDRPLRYESVGRLVRDGTVPVLPLAADELERAIVEPAHSVGAEFEPGLVSEIVADVADQPGALPLLQYALTELYERRVSNLLTRDAYRAIGGVTGALASTAEERYESLSGDEQEAARRMFGRLVTPGEGVEDTRRRVTRSELGDSPGVDAVIHRFGEARLLSFDRDPVTREPTIEVAHEALLGEWPRVRSWLDDDRDGLRIHRHLTETSAAWVASGRDDGELYRGGRLETAEAWAAEHEADLNKTEREFLTASNEAHDADIAAERAQAAQQARSNRRLRVVASIAAVVALVAGISGVVALQQRSRADDEAAKAERNAEIADTARAEAEASAAQTLNLADALGREAAAAVAAESETAQQRDRATAAAFSADFDRLLAQARTADESDPTVGLLLAVEAHRFWSDTGPGSPDVSPMVDTLLDERLATSDFDVVDALNTSLRAGGARVGALPTGAVGNDLTVLDDGRRLVAATADSVQVWDVVDRSLINEWDLGIVGDDSQLLIQSSASGDGRVIAVGGPVASLIIRGDDETIIEHDSGVNRIAVAPDGSRIAFGFVDGVAEVRDADSLDVVAREEWAASISQLVWHPNGTQLAVGTYDSTVALWSPAAGRVEWQQAGTATPLFVNSAGGMLFRADGSELVASIQNSADAPIVNRSRGGRVVLALDVGTGEPAPEILFDDPGLMLAFEWANPDETAVIAVPLSGSVLQIDLADGSAAELVPKSGLAAAFALLPDLGLYAVPRGQSVDLRDIDDSGPLARFVSLADAQRAAAGRFLGGAFSTDGSSFVLSPIIPWTPAYATDLTDPLVDAVPWQTPTDGPASVAVETYGPFTLHTGPEGFTVREGLDGPVQGPPIAVPADLLALSLSHRGDRLALSQGRFVHLYDVTTGSEIRVLDDLPLPEGQIGQATSMFSLDGEFVDTWDGLSSARFRASDGSLVWIADEFGWAYPGPGDDWVATTDFGGVVTIRDATTLEPIGDPLIGHASAVSWFDLGPEGRLLLTRSTSGVARVWDLDLRRQFGTEFAVPLGTSKSYWSPDGSLLAIPRPAGDGYDIWNYDTDTWADIACEVAGRNLTRAEWDEFGPRTVEYRPTCDQYPIEE